MAHEPVTTVHASAARTATGQTAAFPAGIGRSLNLFVDITAVGGDADETMDVTVEWSNDGGTTWAKADAADSMTQMTQPGGAVKRVKQFTIKAPHYRMVYTLAGTTPSFTFSATAYTT